MAHKILFVEDEPDIRMVTYFRLQQAGLEVVVAADGQEALDRAADSQPELILLDLRLPVFSGIEVSRRIKADEKLKHIPVIIFTASTDNIEKHVSEAQADGYLFKPFDPALLMEKINSFLV